MSKYILIIFNQSYLHIKFWRTWWSNTST